MPTKKKTTQNKGSRVMKAMRSVAQNKQVQNVAKAAITAAMTKATGNPQLGASASNALVTRLARLVGSGDYVVSPTPVYNSIFPKSKDFTTPTFGNGAVRLRFREYVGDVLAGVYASGASQSPFTVTSYAIQPGFTNAFPYLSQIASNYEQYMFHGLTYEFVSTCSPYSTTTGGALGSVVLCHESNPARPPYASKFEMENSENAISSRIDQSSVYGVECADFRTKGLLVRSAALSGFSSTQGAALAPFDFGNMYIAVASPSSASGANLGELWVTYDVELSHPRISSYLPGSFHSTSVADIAAVKPLGTATVTFAYGKLVNATITSDATDSIITFLGVQPGDYVYTNITWFGSTQAAVTLTATASATLDANKIFGTGGTASAVQVNDLSTISSTGSTAGTVVLNTTSMSYSSSYRVATTATPGSPPTLKFRTSGVCSFNNCQIVLFVSATGIPF